MIMKLVKMEVLKAEIWKDIPNFQYQISNLGRVRTNRPLANSKGKDIKHFEWRLRVISVGNNGYPGVTLCQETGNREKKRFLIHRLVWQAFVGDIPKTKQIDHINRDKKDSNLANLRLACPCENKRNLHVREGTISGFKGVQVKVNKNNIRFSAYINFQGRRVCLGRFNTSREAALAYNKAAIRLHKEFASLNQFTPNP